MTNEVKITSGWGVYHELDGFPFRDDNDNIYGVGVLEAGGDTTHSVDVDIGEVDDYWNGYYIKFLTGDNAGVYKQIIDWVQATHTFTHGEFANTCDARDTYIVSRWKETDANDKVTWISDGDIITATMTPSADAQTAKIDYHFSTNPLTTTYPKLYVRWKTGDLASPGVKAGIIVTYTAGDPTTKDLGFSSPSLYNFTEIPLSATSYVDKIALTVTSDGATTGTHYVYFDFILVCRARFTCPKPMSTQFIPSPKNVITIIPSMIGDLTENLGSELATVEITWDLTVDPWKRSSPTDYVKGEIFIDISHNSNTELWQWLNFEGKSFKVTLENAPRFSDNNQTVTLNFREKRLKSAVNESYVERFGLNLS